MILIESLNLNPANPRVIKDEKFKKLVASLRSFPQMMDLRPIVVDENNVIQGGNMRYRALCELGYKEIPEAWVKQGKDLTPDQWREFVIKDNVGFGEWDFDTLANEWNAEELQEWGVMLPFAGPEINQMTEDDLDLSENFDPVGESAGMQRVVFLFDDDIQAEAYLKKLDVNYKKMNMAWQVNMSSRSI